MEATIAIPQPDLEYVSEEPQKEDASLGSKKRFQNFKRGFF